MSVLKHGDLETFIGQTLKRLNLSLGLEKIEKLAFYVRAICEYRLKVNVVGVSDEKVLVERHIADVLAGERFFPSVKTPKIIADVGSGGGVLGISLAVMFEEHVFYLVESKYKKVCFLENMREKMNLKNIKIFHKNALEVFDKCDVITTKAFASIKKTLMLTKNMVKKNTTYLLYKGKKETIEQELLEVKKESKRFLIKSQQLHFLKFPFHCEARHIVEFRL